MVSARETASFSVSSELLPQAPINDLRSNAVVGVNHARDAVEAETIELILFHPKSEITQQKPENLMVPVVE